MYNRQNHELVYLKIAGHAFQFAFYLCRSTHNVAGPFAGVPRERVSSVAQVFEFLDRFLRRWHRAALASEADTANQHFRTCRQPLRFGRSIRANYT